MGNLNKCCLVGQVHTSQDQRLRDIVNVNFLFDSRDI